ncbi:leucine-rich repeat domain-containing protein [uncultured Kordia sp.]|uniref:leucine-rich repeat domain-containing protein n=1 Tax=uncultured Kordia sp. TaxID=507699 RepID=UPI00262E0976|nr:leucine-rich repeat domain-containing protein [uncultured Kordia sp.]
MSKPKEILELEAVYGITLEETKDENEIISWRNSNIYFLSKDKQIIGLNLRKNKIKEIKGFNSLTELKKLNISGNQISKIENLDKLKKLSTLHLYGNQISKIENLEKLTNLLTLYIYIWQSNF